MAETEDRYDIQGIPAPEKQSATTEREILDCLKENIRLAAENADKLANGERGAVYIHLRHQLGLVYGCTRQMAGWREDTRWLPFGLKVKEAQERCGKWLVAKEPAWRFRGLAEILRFALAAALELERKKTRRVGMILPEMLAAPIRTEGRPILVPANYAQDVGPVATKNLILPPGVKRETAKSAP